MSHHALLRDHALAICFPSNRRNCEMLDAYIAMVDGVAIGKHLLPYRSPEASAPKAIAFDDLFLHPVYHAGGVAFGNLHLAIAAVDELQKLFYSWHRIDPEAARSSLQALIQSDVATTIIFDDEHHRWGLRPPRGFRRGYVVYASTKWGIRDAVNGAFVSRDMAFAHELQHRFMHPTIFARLRNSSSKQVFGAYRDGSEVVAISYEATLARAHGLQARATHRAGGYVAASDLACHGLQLPYVVDGRSLFLTTGGQITGRVTAIKRNALLVADDFHRRIEIDGEALLCSLVPDARNRRLSELARIGDDIAIAIPDDQVGLPATTCIMLRTRRSHRTGIETIALPATRMTATPRVKVDAFFLGKQA